MMILKSCRYNCAHLFGRGNIKDTSNKREVQKYLSKCHYHEDKDPYCPNFRLGYIATQARENFSELCRTVSFAVSCAARIWDGLNLDVTFSLYQVTVCCDRCCGFLKQGGVIGVFINWNCNLDIDPSNCKPTYSFRRLDLRKDQANSGYYYRLWHNPVTCLLCWFPRCVTVMRSGGFVQVCQILQQGRSGVSNAHQGLRYSFGCHRSRTCEQSARR